MARQAIARKAVLAVVSGVLVRGCLCAHVAAFESSAQLLQAVDEENPLVVLFDDGSDVCAPSAFFVCFRVSCSFPLFLAWLCSVTSAGS